MKKKSDSAISADQQTPSRGGAGASSEKEETAKEELQSANEELSSCNQEPTQVNNDLTNFVSSMGTASIMLGPDLRIRKLTPACAEILNLLPADLGRLLADLPLALEISSLGPILEDTLRSGKVSVREVMNRNGIWYWVEIRPYLLADQKIDGVVISFFDIEDLKRKEKEAQELRQEVETLNKIGRKLSAELDREKLVQAVTDAATSLTGAQFGAFFYNVIGARGESYMLYTISGVSREHFSQFPMPRNTPIFEGTFRGEGIVRLDDVKKDPRYGKLPPHHGQPKGHLPVTSYLAVPVVSRTGEVLGGLFFGHAEAGRFMEKHERLVSGLAAQAAIGIDNAQLYARVAESEKDLSDFFENGALGCHWVGPDGIILRVNETELKLMGYSREEYVGHHIAEFHVDRPVIDDILRRLTAKEVLHETPARMRTKSGQIKDVLIDASVLWREGKFIHTQCFTRDVTEFRSAQEARTRLAAVVESSDDAILTKNLDGIITSWNRGAERLFGYRADEIVGKHITTLIPEALRGEEDVILSRLRLGERVDHFETQRLAKDGTIMEVSLTISPLKDEDGRITGASKVARDITGKKRAEQEIRKLNADLERRVHERTASLEEAVRELEAFSYTVAHDLRAPLRSIHTIGQMLLEDHAAQLDEQGRNYLAQMIEGGSRMDTLTTDLLAYSRLSRERMVLAPVDLEAATEQVLNDMKEELQASQAVVQVAHPLPAVQGNLVMLGHVLSNLISNAAKFVAPGVIPKIQIRAEKRPDPSKAEGDSRVRLWIEDNGIGIEPEHREKLFKVFERLHSRDLYPGTGIGLAIVRRGMERMGGSSGFESVPVRGSRFWIELGTPQEHSK